MSRTVGRHQAQTTNEKRRMSVPLMVILDILAIGIGLIVFALFHHVLNLAPKSDPVVLTTPAPVQEQVATGQDETQSETVDVQDDQSSETEDTDAPEETPEPEKLTWREKFSDKFTDGEVIRTDTSYQSANVCVNYETVESNGVIYHIADIYIADISCFRTALANDAYMAAAQPLTTIAKNNNAIVAITGDHYGARWEGVMVRNGVLYRDTRYADVCVLGIDGVMYTLKDDELDLETLEQSSPWQVWSFGPQLLIDGQVQTEFDSEVARANPRSAIGYYEPGHYCFVQVDGRITDSAGMTLAELSQLFYDLGCTAAYNLDGGQTAAFAWGDTLISHAYGRDAYDAIYIADFAEESGVGEG